MTAGRAAQITFAPPEHFGDVSRMLSHLDAQNRPAMVDIGGKAVTRRTAHAVAVVSLPRPLADRLQRGEIVTKKGAVFHAAVLAGIIGAKKTSEIKKLPCKDLPYTKFAFRDRPLSRCP